MIRPNLLRSLPRYLPRQSTSLARRWASTSVVPPETPKEEASVTSAEADPQLNGYPELPFVSRLRRQPYGWWDMQERRNFGETVPESEELASVFGPDPSPITGSEAVKQVSVAAGLLGIFVYFLYLNSPEAPCVPKAFPYNGLERELGGRPVRAETPEDDE
ncbi:hypothetical protein BCR39DRAFT_517987 [Naematelia encephala]|uniref:Uncharacterized protein n=1 Tax=Naematelia encephala TaxID=71784 RepID=A0A1Y2BGN1_9TREE|nr:hypothetical protein BCR39DRAFT_517987 [Naematelia encephala]